MMGGWLEDDSKMAMDEKKTWGTFGTHFGWDVLIWVKGTQFGRTGHGIIIPTWVYRHLTKVKTVST